ncbi:hypothetical protein [Halococcoides cellulosivorans]|uniref:Uncharacterized protein n=1 Tax=Halococcoides cellulosivorans TaxID=1679096 RepID=A0A2R4X321_9EURY|nr:hypothetical protein [Halococcoides cellulosivorans]AWB28187.1 hypothetical protein HARCEL1_10965 [Halococcoides cellulosivorans]
MKRLQYALVALVVFGLLGGLGVYALHADPVPDEMSVDHRYVPGDVLTESATADLSALGPGASRHLHLTERSAARQSVDGPVATAFVDGTDFSTSSIVVVQIEGSSTPQLRFESLRRTPDGIRLDVALTTWEPRTDDRAVHTLLVRITDHERGAIESVDVRVSGQSLQPTIPFF